MKVVSFKWDFASVPFKLFISSGQKQASVIIKNYLRVNDDNGRLTYETNKLFILYNRN